MEGLEGLVHGFVVALKPENLLFGLVGAFLGTLVGVLPGIGPIGAMAILLSLTFGLPPTTALIMFAGIYYGSMYGGSTTSILVNIPGEASSVVTCIDGYQMARKGRAGAALCLAAAGSFVAGTIALVLLTLIAPKIAQWVSRFGPADYFGVALFGFVVLSRLNEKGMLKSLIMIFLGLVLSTVGMDIITGRPRFTFGIVQLQRGIDFVPAAMGLFGISEILIGLEQGMESFKNVIRIRLKDLLPNRMEVRRSVGPVTRGSFLGFLAGLVPGPAAVISTFLSYTLEKSVSKHKEEFGKGAPEGVAGPEAANNAAAVGAFVPLLSLGIPFAPPTALLLAALMMHDVIPGPLLIKEHPDIFWGVIASMYIGNFLLLLLNLPLVGMFVNVLRIPAKTLMPIILLLCVVGALAVNNSIMDVWVMIISGLAGYAFRKLDFPVAPLVLALVIGPMMENYLRQSLIYSEGHYSIFLTSPVSRILIVLSLVVALLPPVLRLIKRRYGTAY